MDHGKLQTLFDSYCYGPVDLVDFHYTQDTLKLSLKNYDGQYSEATYHDCLYCQLDQGQIGIHLSLVQHISAQQLLQNKQSIMFLKLQKTTRNVARLLHEWETIGLSFYLHLSTNSEFLIAAHDLEYHENY